MGYTSLWFDGFEHYALDQSHDIFGDISKLLDGLWIQAVSGKIVSDNARTGAYSIEGQNPALRRSLGGDFTRVGLQFGLWLGSMPVNDPNGMVFGQFRDAANKGLIGLQISTTGRVRIMKGGLDANGHTGAATMLAESTLELAPGAWNHFEIKAFFDAAGYVKVRINGRDFVSYSGNTIGGSSGSGAGSTCAQVAFGQFDGSITGPGITSLNYDDIAVGTWEDTDDAVFLGQNGVYYLKPNADTATADWSLTTGVHGYALLNEVAPDDDTNFIFTQTVTDKSAFAVEPLPNNIVSVVSVMPIARCRKTDSGTCSVKLGVISNGTEGLAAIDHPLVTSYDWYYDIWMQDPHTSDVWNPLFMPEIEIERTE